MTFIKVFERFEKKNEHLTSQVDFEPIAKFFWQAAQKELRDNSIPYAEGFGMGEAEGRKELANEILQETRHWQVKVSAEKCLNDTIARLEKEARK